MINQNYHCYIVPYFGTLNHYTVDKNFSISKFKNPYRKINKLNYEDLFFDKEHTDNLIVAFKDENEIDSHIKIIEKENKLSDKRSRMRESENWLNYIN